jgi:hypothetical protein
LRRTPEPRRAFRDDGSEGGPPDRRTGFL